MAPSHITEESVLSAIAIYDNLGMQPFLDRYGFKKPTKFWLRHEGKYYVSKAIGNVAQAIGMGQQYSQSIKLAGGGALVRRLRTVGFEVVEEAPSGVQGQQDTEALRNPDWTRDELVLALELYLRNPHSPPGKASEDVRELSKLLIRLGRLNRVRSDETYRNANGVYLKMMNFRALDPRFTSTGRAGMTRGAKSDRAVWDEFHERKEELRALAQLIRKSVLNPDLLEKMAEVDPEDEGVAEGGVSYRLHRVYERDSALRQQKKLQARKAHDRLSCEACDFDFAKTYGAFGEGYIEVHHNKPVSQMKEGDRTRLEDLALLCANCHRIAHRRKDVLSVTEVREMMAREASGNLTNFALTC